MDKMMKPWTWEQIAKLKGKAARNFLETYGDRGKAAMMMAYQWALTQKKHSNSCVGPVYWACTACPLGRESVWRRAHDARFCVDAAPSIYSRMIAKLGLLPEEK